MTKAMVVARLGEFLARRFALAGIAFNSTTEDLEYEAAGRRALENGTSLYDELVKGNRNKGTP